MAGLGKMLKQAAKMQRKVEELQAELEKHEIEVTSGGGAIVIRINGQGNFLSMKLDSEFLKEDGKFVGETILAAVQEAAAKSKEYNEAEMQKVTSAFQMPGLM